jgi:hypothetical protein
LLFFFIFFFLLYFICGVYFLYTHLRSVCFGYL